MKLLRLAVAFVVASPAASRADDSGITAAAGGGVTTFADPAMRDVLSSRVAVWYLDLTFRPRKVLAFDVSYLGSAANVHGATDVDHGILEGDAVEGAVRYNFAPTSAWNPYATIGIGWERYRLRGANFDLSGAGMKSANDLAAFPIGVGLSYRSENGLVLETRSIVRPTTAATLVRVDAATYASMYAWEISAAIGYQL
jgi:hypothetical protein